MIKPLVLIQVRRPKIVMAYLWEPTVEISFPIVAWYIRAGDKNILVDTGASPEVYRRYSPAPVEEILTFEAALGTLGLAPEDIDMVIQTHLHYDHCGNTRKCQNARVVVQEEELKFAYAPHPVFARGFAKELMQGIHWRIVSGDAEVVPGIRVLHVPGHTPGTQAVAIDTEKGTAILSGFCATNEVFYPPESISKIWPVLVPGIHTDVLQAFDNALKIKGLADILIPIHEMEFAQRAQIP